MWRLIAICLTLFLPTVGVADTVQVLPSAMTLTGPKAMQSLLVVRMVDGIATGDFTDSAKFSSSDTNVATVDEFGDVHAIGDGKATITATVNGETTTSNVTVTGSKSPFLWGFREHVLPVMTRFGCNSGACHGALAGKGGLKLSLRGYDPDTDHFVMTRQALSRRTNYTHPEQSLLLRKPTRQVAHGGGTRFTDDSLEYEILRDWIASGATAPAADDARVTRLEVFPSAARMKEGDTFRVVVRAWYDDGHSADVTRWSRFGSSEQLVADVDEAGNVSVTGQGQAAVTIGFGTHVATVPVVSPFPGEAPVDEFKAFRPRGFIDELVLAKLKELNLPPSAECTDREFIRRAFLDTCGILPTPEEVDAFVQDNRPEKRSRLVNALLEREEFVDYWSYYWSDVFLVSTRKLPEPGMWSFYRWVRRNVADNRPWDELARELLTSTGSTLRHGAGNFFVLHTDVAQLTEATSVTFMGMSITCARCHNHPLEKWTQDQYWAQANLFSRVTMKNGSRAGDVLIQPASSGDILHPRRGVAMPPTPLDAEPITEGSDLDRRAYFADWLTSPDNPYFARALVNRVWANFMGRGLVHAVDDLRQTNPPSNVELFDALAEDFVKNGHDVKRLMRLILNSATYQRSAVPLDRNVKDDRFYSHYLIKRLSAEVCLDVYSQVTGVPTPFTDIYTGVENDKKNTPNYPPGTRALQLPDSRVASQFLDSFGRPDREQTCSCEREDDTSVGQALHLNNGVTLNAKLRAKTGRIDEWQTSELDDSDQIRRLFVLALSREPTSEEATRFTSVLSESPKTEKRAAIEDIFWAVLTSKEFLFNH